MVIMKIFILFNIFLFSSNLYEESIVEGSKTYNIEAYYTYDFIFHAIDDGTYFIIFERRAKIYEATGDITGDIIVDNIGFYSNVYAQNFKKGDYVKLQYPGFYGRTTRTDFIRIQKIDANFRLLTDYNTFFSTMAINDCTKPLFIFTYNQQIDEPSTQKVFHAQTHFGQFIGSYRNSEFQKTDSINEGLIDLSLNSLTYLPLYDYNIVKLQCLKPGIITFYFTRKHDSTFGKGIRQSIYTQKTAYTVDFSKEDLVNLYFQGFNLVGQTSFDLKELKGNKYTNNFYTKINSSNLYSTKYYIYVENFSTPSSFMLSFFNFGENNKIIIKEKEQKLVMKPGKLLINLEVITNKKYIKVTSSVDGFYWAYEFSQTEDINYLPTSSAGIATYEKGNTLYINNPYSYQPIMTNFKWFVSLFHYNNEGVIFTYEYVDEKEEENKDNEESDGNEEPTNDNGNEKSSQNGDESDGNKGNSSFFQSIAFWIILILILIIVVLVILFIKNRNKNQTSSQIENLVNNTPNQQII